jgi:5S rRNA maturation endonuclease (ribonuclease M5)
MNRQVRFSESDICRYYNYRVPKLKREPSGFRAPCPLHEGDGPNFAVNPETGQWFCHSTCNRGGDILDLERELSKCDFKTALQNVGNILGVSLGVEREIDKTYDYTDEEGKLLFQVVRYRPKAFVQRHPDGRDGWVWNMKGVRRVLYRLPKVLAATTVYLVEGEKDVETLEKLGLVATTNPMGAEKWCNDYSMSLAGKNVIIVPDNDDKGQRHARQVLASLSGKASSVRMAKLPKGKDVTDWVIAGGTREQLDAMVKAATVADLETDPGDRWDAPIPLDQPALPPFPREALPSWLGDHAEALAQATETPLDLLALLDLAVVATCCARKFEVTPEPGYSEPVNIFTAPAMESGTRKSATLTEATAPLTAWEREMQDQMAPEIARISSKRKTLEMRIDQLRRQAANPKNDMNKLQREIETVEASLPTLPVAPKLWTADATPEQLAVLAYQQGERIAIISDEGGVFDLMAGRYSGGVPNLDFILQAHSGSGVRVDRASRPAILMHAPALTIGLSPQPEVLQGLAGKPGFRGRGLLARFAFALPQSQVGHRKLVAKPMPEQVRAAYAAGVRWLLEKEPRRDSDDKPVAHVLRPTTAAHDRWKEFQRAIEEMMAEGGELAHLRDWAGKLPGLALRFAGLLHCVTQVAAPEQMPIEESTMKSAVEIATILIPHALAVFDLMGADPLLADARAIGRWIKRVGVRQFTARDCFCANQTRFKRMDKLRPVLVLLIEHGYIRAVAQEKVAHRPSELYIVNPKFLEG